MIGIFGQIIQGLGHIRKNWGYHQALKSSNIMIDSHSNIRVTYPLTKTLINNFSKAKISTKSYPKSIYISPYEFECLRSGVEPKLDYENYSDLFALGMIIL